MGRSWGWNPTLVPRNRVGIWGLGQGHWSLCVCANAGQLLSPVRGCPGAQEAV